MIGGDWGRPRPTRRRRLRRWLPLGALGAVITLGALLNHDHRLMDQAVVRPGLGADVRVAEFLLVDKVSGAPVQSAAVFFDDIPAVGLGGGRFAARIPAARSIGEIRTEAYRTLSLPARRDAGQVLQLVHRRIEGTVRDASTGARIPRAAVRSAAAATASRPDGRFTLDDVGPGAVPSIAVSAPGYGSIVLEVGDQLEMDAELEPREIRGAYLTYWGVADSEIRARAVEMVRSGALNALVLDVKGDFGHVLYKSDVPLAQQIGATDVTSFPDAQSFVAEMKQLGVYMVARIVVFKDDVLSRSGARVGLDVGVRDASTGGVWTDLEGLGWTDPFREEVWAYNIALAEEAIRRGFDEVQFDYVRFPTDPGTGTGLDRARYSRVATNESRPRAIADFLGRATEAVHALGGVTAADVFGYVCWMEDDLGIGQHLETLAGTVDYLSPMVYPSTFNGLPVVPSYVDSAAYPYEIVSLSLQRAKERIAGTGTAIRAWLQYFDDYPWASGQRYGPSELAAQRRAVEELNLPGWMWWDPTNLYLHGPASSRPG